MEAQETCQLPDDPTLAEFAVAFNDAGQWVDIVDPGWRQVYMTDDARLMYGGRAGLAPYPVGAHTYGPEAVSMRMQWHGGQWPLEINRRSFAACGQWVLADTPGGREELRELVDPRLRDIVDELSPMEAPAAYTIPFQGVYTGAGAPVYTFATVVRLRDGEGQLAGTAFISKPAIGMATLARITAMGDLRHFERMEQVARPGRRPAALLFADLEASSPLSRRLSTAGYFALGRRVARAADRCVIDAGGLVGRHAGDGVVAFFLAETAGSESTAARGCIEAARALREAMVDVAARSELAPEELTMRFGLHWERPSSSDRSRRAGAPRSPRSAMRSTRERASRHAPPAGVRWSQRRSWSALSPTTLPSSASTPTASPTPLSPTCPRPLRRPAATPRRSPFARYRARGEPAISRGERTPSKHD
jgi:hypothetical protein